MPIDTASFQALIFKLYGPLGPKSSVPKANTQADKQAVEILTTVTNTNTVIVSKTIPPKPSITSTEVFRDILETMTRASGGTRVVRMIKIIDLPGQERRQVSRELWRRDDGKPVDHIIAERRAAVDFVPLPGVKPGDPHAVELRPFTRFVGDTIFFDKVEGEVTYREDTDYLTVIQTWIDKLVAQGYQMDPDIAFNP